MTIPLAGIAFERWNRLPILEGTLIPVTIPSHWTLGHLFWPYDSNLQVLKTSRTACRAFLHNMLSTIPESHSNYRCFRSPMQITSKTNARLLGKTALESGPYSCPLFRPLDKQKPWLRLKHAISQTNASAWTRWATQTGIAQAEDVLQAWEPWMDGIIAHRRIRRIVSRCLV